MISKTELRRTAGVAAAALAMVWSIVATAQPPETAYSLAAGDRLRVTVYGHEDLSGELDVDGNGSISLPLIQTVHAAGLTASQLETAITDRLRPGYLKNPRVNVEVLSHRPFFVLGEVRAPGSYSYASGITVLKAVALAGGFTYRANKDKLKITRETDSGSIEIGVTLDSGIQPGDVIEVPERFF